MMSGVNYNLNGNNVDAKEKLGNLNYFYFALLQVIF
jgi:hypothetical protein